MLYLVTGQPGNGKTLRAMALMLEEYERNQKAVKEGKEQPRRFFSNIAGSYLGDKLTPNPDAFPWVEPMPDHNDWTRLPDGSFVVYDEAHADGATSGLERYGMLFPATGKPGESHDPRVRAMSTHRHRGFDIVLITQYPSKVHHQVRTLVGRHIHMTRAMGLAAAGMLTWSRVQPDPYDEKQREKAEEEIWKYPEELYSRFRSASLHTSAHKFRLPKKVKDGLITGCALLFVAAVAFWWMDWDLGLFTGKGEGGQAQAHRSEATAAPAPRWDPLGMGRKGEEALAATPGMQTFAVLNTEPAPTLSGCAASHRGCLCFNVEGLVIDLAESECRALLDRPLPFNAQHQFAGSRERDTERDRREPSSQAREAIGIGEAGEFPRYGEFRDSGRGPDRYESTFSM